VDDVESSLRLRWGEASNAAPAVTLAAADRRQIGSCGSAERLMAERHMAALLLGECGGLLARLGRGPKQLKPGSASMQAVSCNYNSNGRQDGILRWLLPPSCARALDEVGPAISALGAQDSSERRATERGMFATPVSDGMWEWRRCLWGVALAFFAPSGECGRGAVETHVRSRGRLTSF
jgi:hypothetical protein